MRVLQKSLNLSIAQSLYVSAALFGGVTLNSKNEKITSGFISGIDKKGLEFNSISEVNEHVLSQFITENKPEFIGSWKDTETGKIYFDIVNVFVDKYNCIEFAVRNKQLAIFDLNTNNEIRL